MSVQGRVGLCVCVLFAVWFAMVGSVCAQDVAPWPNVGQNHVSQRLGARDAAVLVGVDHYMAAPRVPGATQNVEDWYRWLVESRGVPASRVTLLRDREGTLEKMRAALDRAAQSVGRGGTVWFVFVGHGAPLPSGKGGVLVGSDAQQDPESLFARSLSQRDVFKRLSKGKHAHTVAVFDTCFSGLTPTGKPLLQGIQPLVPLSGVQLPPKLSVFTAAGAGQFAGPLPGAQRPAFSYLLLGGLRGWADANNDQRVTPQEAIAYTQNTLQTVLRGRTQTPEYQTSLRNAPPLAVRATDPAPNLTKIVLSAHNPTARAPHAPCPAGSVLRDGACMPRLVTACPAGFHFAAGQGCVPKLRPGSVGGSSTAKSPPQPTNAFSRSLHSSDAAMTLALPDGWVQDRQKKGFIAALRHTSYNAIIHVFGGAVKSGSTPDSLWATVVQTAKSGGFRAAKSTRAQIGLHHARYSVLHDNARDRTMVLLGIQNAKGESVAVFMGIFRQANTDRLLSDLVGMVERSRFDVP